MWIEVKLKGEDDFGELLMDSMGQDLEFGKIKRVSREIKKFEESDSQFCEILRFGEIYKEIPKFGTRGRGRVLEFETPQKPI